MARPLEGIRVLDMGTFITGPAAGMLLADLGADVVLRDPSLRSTIGLATADIVSLLVNRPIREVSVLDSSVSKRSSPV